MEKEVAETEQNLDKPIMAPRTYFTKISPNHFSFIITYACLSVFVHIFSSINATPKACITGVWNQIKIK